MPNALILLSCNGFFSHNASILFCNVSSGNVLTLLLKRAELSSTLLNLLTLIFQRLGDIFVKIVTLAGDPAYAWAHGLTLASRQIPTLASWHRGHPCSPPHLPTPCFPHPIQSETEVSFLCQWRKYSFFPSAVCSCLKTVLLARINPFPTFNLYLLFDLCLLN